MMILFVLILIGLVGILIFYKYQSSSQVYILSSSETANFLRSDPDRYVQSLSSADLHARGVRTQQEYLITSVNSAVDASEKEREIIISAVATVDKFLRTNPQLPISAKALLHLPWKIAITQGKRYESGYPHTRKDVIFLDKTTISNPEFVATLLHEKVHVYQRTYPNELQDWLTANGYKRTVKRSSIPLARANPDLDEWIYIDPATKKEMVALYNSPQPQSISDIKLSNYAFEHPYELMAYQIAELKNNA